MSCCVEQAILAALRDIAGTPVASENHFLIEKKTGDCYPYLVVKVETASGLRTSSAVQKIHSVEVSSYFRDAAEQQALDFKQLIEDWVMVSGCLELGACGCFCIQGPIRSQLRRVAGGVLRHSLTFRGEYSMSEAGSSSASQ